MYLCLPEFIYVCMHAGVHILNQGQWLNMNVVEDKKMEWMKDLSPLTTNIANVGLLWKHVILGPFG